jgi:hypothetical protein
MGNRKPRRVDNGAQVRRVADQFCVAGRQLISLDTASATKLPHRCQCPQGTDSLLGGWY